MERVSSLQIRGLALAIVLGLVASPVTATTLSLVPGADSILVGESTDVCVDMSGSNGDVVAVQLNMSWDKCLEPVDVQKLCTVNPATGKTVQSASQSKSELKAIMISFTDVSPIPDGQLLCCTLQGRRGADSCAVTLSNIIGSTAAGERIDGIGTQGASIAVVKAKASDENIGGPSTGGGGGDSGCALRATSNGNHAAAILLLVGLALVGLRRRHTAR